MALWPDKANNHDSSTTSASLDLKTPMPKKKHGELKAPLPVTSEDLTEPESPPCEVKSCSLKQLGGYLDLGDLDSILHKPTTASKKSGSRAVGSKKWNKTDTPTGNSVSAWREWKAREVAVEEPMDVLKWNKVRCIPA